MNALLRDLRRRARQWQSHRYGERQTHIPQPQLAVERAGEEEAVVARVEGDRRNEVEVLKSAEALVARDVPQAHGLVHR